MGGWVNGEDVHTTGVAVDPGGNVIDLAAHRYPQAFLRVVLRHLLPAEGPALGLRGLSGHHLLFLRAPDVVARGLAPEAVAEEACLV